MNPAEMPPTIYERLVRERGDVPAETRMVAEQTQRQAKQALDWSGLRLAEKEREERSFSPFG